MNKKLIAILAVLTLIAPVAAKANTPQQPTIAILDTAVDMTVPGIAKNVVYEVCVMEAPLCPNSKTIMEGPGSATFQHPFVAQNGFEHGTQMVYAAISANPNVRIVFVRIIGNTLSGGRAMAGTKTVENALDWVIQNKERFNIQAVSMAQSHHNLGPAGTDYCPKNTYVINQLNTLKSINVGVFFPAGNLRDYSRISWPACNTESISVGATMPTGEVAIYSNYDSARIDFVALGTMRLTSAGNRQVNVAGTSAATQIAATNWFTVRQAKPNLGYQETLDLLNRTATITKNSKVSGAKLINVNGALNG